MSVLPRPTTTVVPALPEGWHVLSFNVLAGSRLAIAGANADLHAAWQSDRAQKTVGEAWRLAQRAKATLWWLLDDQLYAGLQFPLLEQFPIVEQFPDLSRFAVMKHLDVLRQAALVLTREEGRQRINSLNAVPIRMIYERWVSSFEGNWASTLLRVKEAAERAASARSPAPPAKALKRKQKRKSPSRS